MQDNDCQLGMLREYYFHLISKQNSEDQQPCLEILRSLTKDGMNLTYIDEQVSASYMFYLLLGSYVVV